MRYVKNGNREILKKGGGGERQIKNEMRENTRERD